MAQKGFDQMRDEQLDQHLSKKHARYSPEVVDTFREGLYDVIETMEDDDVVILYKQVVGLN